MTPEELKRWQKAHRYNNNELAKVLEVSIVTITQWRGGRAKISKPVQLALKWLETQGN